MKLLLDESIPRKLASHFPDVKFYQSEENTGFAHANNVAARYASVIDARVPPRQRAARAFAGRVMQVFSGKPRVGPFVSAHAVYMAEAAEQRKV